MAGFTTSRAGDRTRVRHTLLAMTTLLGALAICVGGTARAAQVLGKGGSCAAVWDTGAAGTTTLPRGTLVACTDGDPTCDLDGTVNDSCTVGLNACAGMSVGGCTPTPLTRLRFSRAVSLRLVGFEAPPMGGAGCGTPGQVTLALRRRPPNPRKPLRHWNPSSRARFVMHGSKHFVDRLAVQCVPCTGTDCGVPPPPPPPGCTREAPGLPAQLTLTVPVATSTKGNGSDLDNGWTGTSHNFPVVGGSSLKYCLTGCDGTTTFDCTATGTTAAGSDPHPLNGATFGAPLPLLAANVPVCVVNRFQDGTLTGTYNVQTGAGGSADHPNVVRLFSDVYLRSTFPEVCPRCTPTVAGGGIGSAGKCSGTAKDPGADCIVDGQVTVAGKGDYLLSSACTPQGDSGGPNGTLDIELPFSTGASGTIVGPLPCRDSSGLQTQDDGCGSGTCTATCTGAACVDHDDAGNCIDSKGGISQVCCSGATDLPCFPTRGGGSFSRTGSPGTDGQTQVSAATFCIARTSSSLINITTGLPGPGALLLPNLVHVDPSQ